MPNDMNATPCARCNGTGEYHGTRRDGTGYVGRCFACQGDNATLAATHWRCNVERLHAMPNQETVPSRMNRAERSWQAFATRYPAEAAWLQSSASGDFGASLIKGCRRYGGLTPRQLAAVQRNVSVFPVAALSYMAATAAHETAIGTHRAPASMDATDVLCHERAAIRSAGDSLIADLSAPAPIVGATPEGALVTEQDVRNGAQVTLSSMGALSDRNARERERILAAGMSSVGSLGRPAPGVIIIDATSVRRAMDAAAASGLRKVRLVLGAVTFKLSGSRFMRGAGMILAYHDGSYKGWIDRENVFHPGMSFAIILRDTTHAAGHVEITAFRVTARNPQAAARTYGQDQGRCACCRRLLTDPVSVMSNIGPVCARRFGWGSMIRTAASQA